MTARPFDSGSPLMPQGGEMKLSELERLLPNAAVETSCNGEVVIWTGWAVDPKDPDGPLVQWCEDCESGADVLDDGCTFCGRALLERAKGLQTEWRRTRSMGEGS